MNTKRSTSKYIGAISFALLATLVARESVATDALPKIPRGYQAGRPDAIYGTYFTVVNQSARSLQSRLNNLENRVMGFSSLASEDRIKQAEAEFVLEHAIFKLHLDISNTSDSVLTPFERQSMLFTNIRTYQSLRFQAERLFEDMVRFIDVQLPGPNGLQLRSESGLDSIYLPNFRIDTALNEQERAKQYSEKRTEFLAKGGTLSEITTLTPASLAAMGSYTRLEYVVAENGEIKVTPGSAGHILLAEGLATKAAGQLIFIKDRAGHFTMAVISNSSGSFKPDIFSILPIAEQIAKLTNLPSSHVIVTKGEPLSTQAVKVYSKGYGLPKEQTESRIARLKTMDSDLKLGGAASHALQCRNLFEN